MVDIVFRPCFTAAQQDVRGNPLHQFPAEAAKRTAKAAPGSALPAGPAGRRRCPAHALPGRRPGRAAAQPGRPGRASSARLACSAGLLPVPSRSC